ncbi:MAG: beta-aspartyl-peptidase [Clostridiaceae bacterium]|nr:beta-aspartyl-peptidase [Clostridiaceae bacterium]
MYKLLKGGKCFSPIYIGKKDILIACGKICKVDDNISKESLGTIFDTEVINCSGKIVCPGFIDQHVHITGGGGEQGPGSKIRELELPDIVKAGVCTVVGVLGTDSMSRSIGELLTKALALNEEGITAYIYTGNYNIPTQTLTGSIKKDLTYIDRIIGLGEIAISDYRSSHPSLQTLKELAAEVIVGSLLGQKPGIMHMHVGDGKDGIGLLFQLIEESDFPIEMFVPTHINRNKDLFRQGFEYLKMGGNIDLTAGETSETRYSVSDALEMLFGEGINTHKISVSSDGNGSIPEYGHSTSDVCKVVQLYKDIRTCIVDKNLNIEQVLKTVTLNVANILKLYPEKGLIAEGSDADILIIDENEFNINKVIAKGQILMDI